MEKKIIENVKFWKYEAEITFTDKSQISFVWEPNYDVSESEIEEWMTEQNIAPESIEQYAYQFPNKLTTLRYNLPQHYQTYVLIKTLMEIIYLIY